MTSATERLCTCPASSVDTHFQDQFPRFSPADDWLERIVIQLSDVTSAHLHGMTLHRVVRRVGGRGSWGLARRGRAVDGGQVGRRSSDYVALEIKDNAQTRLVFLSPHFHAVEPHPRSAKGSLRTRLQLGYCLSNPG